MHALFLPDYRGMSCSAKELDGLEPVAERAAEILSHRKKETQALAGGSQQNRKRECESLQQDGADESSLTRPRRPSPSATKTSPTSISGNGGNAG